MVNDFYEFLIICTARCKRIYWYFCYVCSYTKEENFNTVQKRPNVECEFDMAS